MIRGGDTAPQKCPDPPHNASDLAKGSPDIATCSDEGSVMMQSCWKRQLRHCAIIGALALVAIATPGSVRAQDDDPDDNALSRWERKVWNGVVRGLGLRGDEPPIEYRERSPLVVPPSRDLPPPQANARPKAAAWPVDPDAKRAKERADAKKKKGAIFVEEETYSRPLTPEQLNPPGTGTTTTTGSTTTPADARPGDRLLPSELGYFGGVFSWQGFGFGAKPPEVGTFTREPPRTELTAPPSGYQTPSTAQPYGTTPRIEWERPEAHDPSK
jgi:hypothetical protein